MFYYYYGLLVAVILNAFQLSGAQGFHVQIDTCRGNCSIPAGQIVQINCTVAVGCDPLSHPLRMLRVTSEGIEEITPRDNDRGIMPGFISLETMECSLRLTFTASLAANNVVLQCGVSTNEVMEYSKARVLAVRESPSTASPDSVTTSPSPTVVPSTTSSTTDITSPPTTASSLATSDGTLGTGSSAPPTDCVCSIPTVLPTSLFHNGAQTHSLTTRLTLILTFLSITLSVFPPCL